MCTLPERAQTYGSAGDCCKRLWTAHPFEPTSYFLTLPLARAIAHNVWPQNAVPNEWIRLWRRNGWALNELNKFPTAFTLVLSNVRVSFCGLLYAGGRVWSILR